MSYQLRSAASDDRAEFYGEQRTEEARPRLRGVLTTAAALLVMGLFAGSIWFAYVQGTRHPNAGGGDGEAPLIRADERPMKVKPDKPGGMEVPDRDKLIYTQKRAAVEHLLPPPEKPMPRPTPAPTPTARPEAPQPPSASAAAPIAASAPATAQSIVPPPQPQQQAATPSGKIPLGSATPAKQAATSSPNVNASGTRLQLGSVHSEEVARQEWDRIKRANADLLGGFSATPIRANLGEKGVFYRIQTGPLADADRICGELKRRNIGCIIAR